MNRLRAGSSKQLAGVTLIPVEWITMTAQQEAGHAWLQVGKEAVAVLICEAGHCRLLDVNGEVLPLEQWLSRVEGLEAGMQACRSGQGGP